jgi:hypothetical protein
VRSFVRAARAVNSSHPIAGDLTSVLRVTPDRVAFAPVRAALRDPMSRPFGPAFFVIHCH